MSSKMNSQVKQIIEMKSIDFAYHNKGTHSHHAFINRFVEQPNTLSVLTRDRNPFSVVGTRQTKRTAHTLWIRITWSSDEDTKSTLKIPQREYGDNFTDTLYWDYRDDLWRAAQKTILKTLSKTKQPLQQLPRGTLKEHGMVPDYETINKFYEQNLKSMKMTNSI